ncbi:MAG: M14 family metallopeptidase [Actinomycetota bacterium]|nr:M14 family metallopeptidase [Actinomycetota bacterium]
MGTDEDRVRTGRWVYDSGILNCEARRALKALAVPLSLLLLLMFGSAAVASADTFIIGKSVKYRPIEVRRFGDPGANFRALIVGSVHGNEPQGIRMIRRLNRMARPGLKRVDLWTISTINPDGIARGTRKNARGVDLNRNFPYRFDPDLDDGYNSGPGPLSEPESRAVLRLVRNRKFDLSIWYHQPWGRTLIPCNATARFARRYSRMSGLGARPGCDRPVRGSATDWMFHRFGTKAFVVEFAAGRLHAPVVKRHARAALRLMKGMRPGPS